MSGLITKEQYEELKAFLDQSGATVQFGSYLFDSDADGMKGDYDDLLGVIQNRTTGKTIGIAGKSSYGKCEMKILDRLVKPDGSGKFDAKAYNDQNISVIRSVSEKINSMFPEAERKRIGTALFRDAIMETKRHFPKKAAELNNIRILPANNSGAIAIEYVGAAKNGTSGKDYSFHNCPTMLFEFSLGEACVNYLRSQKLKTASYDDLVNLMRMFAMFIVLHELGHIEFRHLKEENHSDTDGRVFHTFKNCIGDQYINNVRMIEMNNLKPVRDILKNIGLDAININMGLQETFTAANRINPELWKAKNLKSYFAQHNIQIVNGENILKDFLKNCDQLEKLFFTLQNTAYTRTYIDFSNLNMQFMKAFTDVTNPIQVMPPPMPPSPQQQSGQQSGGGGQSGQQQGGGGSQGGQSGQQDGQQNSQGGQGGQGQQGDQNQQGSGGGGRGGDVDSDQEQGQGQGGGGQQGQEGDQKDQNGQGQGGQQGDQQGQDGQGQGQGQGQQGQDQDGQGQGQGQGKDGEGNQKGFDPNDPDTWDQGQNQIDRNIPEGASNDKAVQEALDETIRNVKDAASKGNVKGKKGPPGSGKGGDVDFDFDQNTKAAASPKEVMADASGLVDKKWKEVLKRIIEQATGTKIERKTYLPSRRREGMFGASKILNTLDNVVFSFDMSGSMDIRRDFATALSYINDLMGMGLEFEKIGYIYWGTSVHVFGPKKFSLKNVARDAILHKPPDSLGGTDFDYALCPLVSRCDSVRATKYTGSMKSIANKIDLMVVFTDGAVNPPTDERTRQWLHKYRKKVIYVITPGGGSIDRYMASVDPQWKRRAVKVPKHEG